MKERRMKKAAWLLGLLLVACKKEEAAAPAAKVEQAVVAKAAREPSDVVYAASAHLRNHCVEFAGTQLVNQRAYLGCILQTSVPRVHPHASKLV